MQKWGNKSAGEKMKKTMCSLSLYTHRVSESLMAVNCSGGSGPSSSETQSNVCLLKILQVSVALFRLFKCYIIALIIILALFHFLNPICSLS